jgi:hypothetical protein
LILALMWSFGTWGRFFAFAKVTLREETFAVMKRT